MICAAIVEEEMEKRLRAPFGAVAVLAPLFVAASPAAAWWDGGHKIVAAVAWPLLKLTVQNRIGQLLKLNPNYSKWVDGVAEANKSETAFIMASVWADDIKSDHGYVDDGNDPLVENANENIGYQDKLMHKYWHYIESAVFYRRDETRRTGNAERPNPNPGLPTDPPVEPGERRGKVL